MSKRIVLLQALASTPNDLALMLKGVAGTVARQRPAPDQWAIADVVNHLIHVEGRYLERLRRVLEVERPSLPAILPDKTKHETQVTLSELIVRFEKERDGTLSLLKEIAPGGWQRTAVHETRGDVTLRVLVQFLVEHDITHLNQIVEIQQRLRALPKRDAQPAIRSST
jgi:uncharacterized damage-inducible protein DinB